jgi:hypothetical protein
LAEFCAVTVVDVENGAALVSTPSGGLSHGIIDSGVPSSAFEYSKSQSADKGVFFSGCDHELIPSNLALNMGANQGTILIFQQ